jgi:hypothetical protein
VYRAGEDRKGNNRVNTGWTVRDGIPVGTRISAPFQTELGVHPASLTLGIGVIPVVNLPYSSLNFSPSTSAEVSDVVELYFYCPCGRF